MCVIVELLRSIVQKIWRGVIIFTYTIQIILSHLLQDFILFYFNQNPCSCLLLPLREMETSLFYIVK